jgi:simple sugar transport system permease protein
MIPALFKAKYGTNETLFTLMLNYVAVYTVQFLREGPWRDPGGHGFPKIAMFARQARFPAVLGIQGGWIVAAALAVLVYVYVNNTKQGYELRVVGENENTARYAGMNVFRITVRTLCLSAGICGIATRISASADLRPISSSSRAFSPSIRTSISRTRPRSSKRSASSTRSSRSSTI